MLEFAYGGEESSGHIREAYRLVDLSVPWCSKVLSAEGVSVSGVEVWVGGTWEPVNVLQAVGLEFGGDVRVMVSAVYLGERLCVEIDTGRRMLAVRCLDPVVVVNFIRKLGG